jgi:hypothetical protein
LTDVTQYPTVVNGIFILEGVLVILSWSDGHIESRVCGDVGYIIQMAISVVPSLAWMCCLENVRIVREICSKLNVLGMSQDVTHR